MSLYEEEVIALLSDRAVMASAAQNRTPYQPFDEREIDRYGKPGEPLPFPTIGSYIPPGWIGVDRILYQTVEDLKAKLLAWELEGKDYGYAFVRPGYLRAFERLPAPEPPEVTAWCERFD